MPRRIGALVVVMALLPAVAACRSSVREAYSNTTTTTSTSTTSTTTTTTTTTTLPPTTTTEPIIVKDAIVMVANCADKSGAATTLTELLAGVGYATRPPTNGAGPDEKLASTKIYVVAGNEEAALSVSRLLGDVPVLPMPTPAWITGATAALGDANILVMLGADLAGKGLPGLDD